MEFLLELLTEDLPAPHARAALEQLKGSIGQELRGAGVAVESLETIGTPRRLVVFGEFAAGLTDSEDTVVGPPRSVGIGPDGAYTQAARGFARSQGVADTELEVIRTARGEYLGIRKKRKGRLTSEILLEIVPRVLASLTFSKTMRWGEGPFRFSRPIHGLLVLFGGRPLDLVFEGLRAGDVTWGHRIHGPEKIRVGSVAEYRELLLGHGVMADPRDRREAILAQMSERLAPLGAEVYPDPGLLEELVFNVEYPLVIVGDFPEPYLSLPLDVLATAMRAGQKLFSVVKDGKQLPMFVGIADAREDSKGYIRKGNERVLKARLEDAKFFWEQDRKVRLAERAKGLGNVVFQEKLGSYEDKCQRLKKIVVSLAEKTGSDKIRGDLMEAAGLCKADLLTEMVKEFPSLQGKMGGLYASAEGYPATVHKAIYEHYRPLGLEDESPSSAAGTILSISDKADSVVGVIGLGVEISGSSDPFGLRRNALGIVKTVLDRKLRFSFGRLLDRVFTSYGAILAEDRAGIKATCLEFFKGRMRFILERRGHRYDLVSAALGPGIDDLYCCLLRAEALDSLKSSPLFEPFILMAKRVNNILRDQPPCRFDPELLVEKQERELHSSFTIIRDNARRLIAKGDFPKAQNIIFKIQPALNTFFDTILVMAKEKRLRRNRLGLLQAIQKLLAEMADYSQVVVEGEKTPPAADTR
jgi:glycyl-tRNA synthetase beta chain